MRLGDANFLNLFARLAAQTNADRDCHEWRAAGVQWSRQRTVQWSSGLSHQIEVHCLRHTAKPSWTLYFVHEMWWGESRDKTIRNVHWTRVERGSQQDILRWFKSQEEELER